MRVGVNTLFLIPGEVGGSQTYLLETLRALAAGYPETSLVLFTHLENDAYLRERLEAYRPISFDCLRFKASRRPVRILREQIELPWRVRRHRLDGLWSPGYTAPRVGRVPQVVSILDMQYQRFPDDLTPLARKVTHLLVSMATRRARRILTLSEFSKSEIIQLTAAAHDRIDVAPLAANPVFSLRMNERTRIEILRRLLPDDAPFLFCVANTYPHKNVATLVDAFGRLIGRLACRLVLVGKPRRGEPAVRQALAALPDGAPVTRLESVTLDELVALYQSCETFVFPSLYEGFGLPVLEAMSAGTPVVAADIPPALEIGGEWIWRCNARDPAALANAVCAAVNEPPAKRRRRIDGARRRAQTFDWAHTARRTHTAFEKAWQTAAD